MPPALTCWFLCFLSLVFLLLCLPLVVWTSGGVTILTSTCQVLYRHTWLASTNYQPAVYQNWLFHPHGVTLSAVV